MPNWCSTMYQIKGPEKEMDELHKSLLAAQKKAKIKTDFGEMWLGHLLSYLGMKEEDVVSGKVRCRGSITYIKNDEGIMALDTETAWGPMPEPIMMMCEKYAPSAQVFYTAIEPGMGMYITNDPETANTYLLDIWCPEDLPENLQDIGFEHMKPDELKKELETALGHQNGLAQLICEAETKWEDAFTINKLDFCEISSLY